jgi:hypothetical protein
MVMMVVGCEGGLGGVWSVLRMDRIASWSDSFRAFGYGTVGW